MITNTNYLGIYSGAIDDAIGECETALSNLGFAFKEIQDVHEMAFDDLKETGDFSDITNSVIGSYFRVTEDVIKQRFPEKDVYYYVNCTDSHFYVDGEEQMAV